MILQNPKKISTLGNIQTYIFIMVVDDEESELGILDLIHVKSALLK